MANESKSCRRTVFFTMVNLPSKGWTRVGNAYGSFEVANSWLDFVSKANGHNPSKVEELALNYADGVLDEKTIRTLDEKFNLDYEQ